MKSAKHGSDKNRKLSNHTVTLHQRLYQALNLGIKSQDKEERKWQCTDIEIQRLAVRSISAFIGCISSDLLRQQIIENSIADILVALEGIIQSRNEAVLGMATNVTMKLVDILGNSVILYNLSKLVDSLSSLLSFNQPSVAISCAITLNHILLKLKPGRYKKHHEVWERLVERKIIGCIICNLRDSVSGSKTFDCFQEMASLLKTIMWQWPPSRYPAWSSSELMEALRVASAKSDSDVEIAVLQLYSALALCGNGAMKLIEAGQTVLPVILRCMGSVKPISVRIEAFKLAQHLMRFEQGFLAVTKLCCEPIVKSTVDAIDVRNFSGKGTSDQVPLLMEACRLALITRWAGNHHMHFWKFGIDRALLSLLHNNFESKQSQSIMSPRELISFAYEAFNSNYNLALRPYIWDILGWLSTHRTKELSPSKEGNFNCLNILIACACLVFKDSIDKGRQVCQNDVSYSSMYEPASRAVMLMIYSPCEYISSQARHIMSKLILPSIEYLKHLRGFMKSDEWYTFCVWDKPKTLTSLIHFICYLGFPEHRSLIIECGGTRTLMTLIEWCLTNQIQIQRSKVALHLRNTFDERTCCLPDGDDWDGPDILLLLSLWGLAELMQPSSPVKNTEHLFYSQLVDDRDLDASEIRVLIKRLHEISWNTFSPGCRRYAAYILSLCGVYGYPSKLGKRIGKAFDDKEHADVLLRLSSDESLSVHGVVLIARCPNLLPAEELPPQGENFRTEIRLSSRVDRKPLIKLLEFTYLGYVGVEDDLVKQLKILAKACNFDWLSCLLSRKRPKWGMVIPSYDFTSAIGSVGHPFSDVILEAKATTGKQFTCNVCSNLTPHMHVHKIILCLSCDYLRALFQSGMQESQSHIIKVSVGWEALTKLINWFYSDELPKPSSGCLWDNMDMKQQLNELNPYVELCSLAEFWFLEDVREDALKVVVSYLNSSRHLCMDIMQFAANFSQWEIVDIAANYLAPMYPHMRDSGALESLNDELVDMVRVAYVQLTQQGTTSSQ